MDKKINGREYGIEEWIASCKQYINQCQKKLEVLDKVECLFTEPSNEIFNTHTFHGEKIIYQGKELDYFLYVTEDVQDILRSYFEKARQEIFYKIELNKKYIENADEYFES